MAVNYDIKANVVDIKLDNPKVDDSFFVDTNVWYWLTYLNASLADAATIQYQIDNYPSYTKKVLDKNGKIYHSCLSFAELSHLIERKEYEIFAEANPNILNKERFDKKFRHEMEEERKNVVEMISSSWSQVIGLSIKLKPEVDSFEALQCLKRNKVDGYDLFMLESMKKKNIDKIITDDGDFATVSGITVFTANRNVIRLAKQNGKYLER